MNSKKNVGRKRLGRIQIAGGGQTITENGHQINRPFQLQSKSVAGGKEQNDTNNAGRIQDDLSFSTSFACDLDNDLDLMSALENAEKEYRKPKQMVHGVLESRNNGTGANKAVNTKLTSSKVDSTKPGNVREIRETDSEGFATPTVQKVARKRKVSRNSVVSLNTSATMFDNFTWDSPIQVSTPLEIKSARNLRSKTSSGNVNTNVNTSMNKENKPKKRTPKRNSPKETPKRPTSSSNSNAKHEESSKPSTYTLNHEVGNKKSSNEFFQSLMLENDSLELSTDQNSIHKPSTSNFSSGDNHINSHKEKPYFGESSKNEVIKTKTSLMDKVQPSTTFKSDVADQTRKDTGKSKARDRSSDSNAEVHTEKSNRGLEKETKKYPSPAASSSSGAVEMDDDNNSALDSTAKSVDGQGAVIKSDQLSLSSWGLPETVLKQYTQRGITHMFEWQAECLLTGNVLDGGNLVYSAPTSAGKTMVAELLVLKRVMETRKKAIIILPFVSVTREKMFYLQELYQDAGIRVSGFMGHYAPAGGFSSVDVAVCTIEKGNGLINRLLEENKLDKLGIIVVDELHLLGDPHRGYLLELLLTKISYMTKKFVNNKQGETETENPIQIVGMSATLPNLDLLANWLNADLYRTDYRPVPLMECMKIGTAVYNNNMEIIRDVDIKYKVKGDTEHVIPLCIETLKDGHSILIFCPTKNWCEKLSETIAREFYNLLKNPEIATTTQPAENSAQSGVLVLPLNRSTLQDIVEQLRRTPVGVDQILGLTVPYGVAYHHAGLTFDERDIVEGAFRQGILKVLVATSTLSSGVNLPARRVLIRTPVFHGGKVIDFLTYKQMIGRAGRKGVDTAGESILLCKPNEKSKAMELVTGQLPPVKSTLIKNEGEELSSSMKRAILEVVVSGVAMEAKDVASYASCTLLAASLPADSGQTKTLIEQCIGFLQENEFVCKQAVTNEDGSKTERFIPTQLGAAVLASSLSPDEGLAVFSELQRARQCFVLENELHIIYQVTPIYSGIGDYIDWYQFFCIWESLPAGMRKVAEMIGVQESYLAKSVRGRVPVKTAAQQISYAIHKRFYTALVLHDLVQEVPLSAVAKKYNCNKGQLQSLQQSAATFAGMVTVFCARLCWSNLELILSQFQNRLTFGVQRELCDLVRISTLNGQRARVLYNGGYQTVAALASANPADIEALLKNSAPFQSTKRQGTETEWEAEERRKSRCIFLTGRKGVTEYEAAVIIIDEAKAMIQDELGGLGIQWDGGRNKPDLNVSKSPVVTSPIPTQQRRRLSSRKSLNRKRKSHDTSGGSSLGEQANKASPTPPKRKILNPAEPTTSKPILNLVVSPPTLVNVKQTRDTTDNKTTGKDEIPKGPTGKLPLDSPVSEKTTSDTSRMKKSEVIVDNKEELLETLEIVTGENERNKSCAIDTNTPVVTSEVKVTDKHILRADESKETNIPLCDDHKTSDKISNDASKRQPNALNVSHTKTNGNADVRKDVKQISDVQKDTVTPKSSTSPKGNDAIDDEFLDTFVLDTQTANSIICNLHKNSLTDKSSPVNSDVNTNSKAIPEEVVNSEALFSENIDNDCQVENVDDNSGINNDNKQNVVEDLHDSFEDELHLKLSESQDSNKSDNDLERNIFQASSEEIFNNSDEMIAASNYERVGLTGETSVNVDRLNTSYEDLHIPYQSGQEVCFEHADKGGQVNFQQNANMFTVNVTTNNGKCDNRIGLFSSPEPAKVQINAQVESDHSFSSTFNVSDINMEALNSHDKPIEKGCVEISPDTHKEQTNNDQNSKVTKRIFPKAKVSPKDKEQFGDSLTMSMIDQVFDGSTSDKPESSDQFVCNKMTNVAQASTSKQSCDNVVFTNEMTSDNDKVVRHEKQNTSNKVQEKSKGGSYEFATPKGRAVKRSSLTPINRNCKISKKSDSNYSTPNAQRQDKMRTNKQSSGDRPKLTSDGVNAKGSLKINNAATPNNDGVNESPSTHNTSTGSDCVPPTPPETDQSGSTITPKRTPLRSLNTIGFSPRLKSTMKNGTTKSDDKQTISTSAKSGKNEHTASSNALSAKVQNEKNGVKEVKVQKGKGKRKAEVKENNVNPKDVMGIEENLESETSDMDTGADLNKEDGEDKFSPSFIDPEESGITLTQASFTIIDVCADKRLFKTFIMEWRTKARYAVSVACEKRPQQQATGSGIGAKYRKDTTPSKSDSQTDGIIIEGSDLVVVGVAVSWDNRDAYYVSFTHSQTQGDFNESLAPPPSDKDISVGIRIKAVKSVLQQAMCKDDKVTIVMFDVKAQYRCLAEGCGFVPKGMFEDPKVACWMLDPGARERTLHGMVTNLLPSEVHLLHGLGGGIGVGSLGLSPENPGTGRYRATTECVLVRHLAEYFRACLSKEGLLDVYTEVEMPAAISLCRMELNGFGFSEEESESQKSVMIAKLSALEEQAYSLAGHPFSLSATEDISQILYFELQLPPNGDPTSMPVKSLAPRGVGARRAKPKAQYSTSKDILEKLKKLHPLPGVILEWRRITNALTKVVFPLQKEKIPCDYLSMYRIYSECQLHSATGRVSLSEPNLQNVPKDFEIVMPDIIGESPTAPGPSTSNTRRRTRAGSKLQQMIGVKQAARVTEENTDAKFSISMRHAFVPFQGGVLLAADYSQLELRMIAYLSKDDKLIGILNEDADVFKLITAQWKNITPDEVTPEQRSQAKQVCYGMIYGIGPKALGEQLDVDENDAAAFIETFKAKYPGMRRYLRKTVDVCREKGYVQTMVGRKRYLQSITSTNPHARAQAERQAVNTTVQGSAADLVKRAMIKIDEQLHEKYQMCQYSHKQKLPGKHPARQTYPPDGAYLVLQLHDELIYEVKTSQVNEVATIVKNCMEHAMDLPVKMPVKIKVGESWGTLKDMEI